MSDTLLKAVQRLEMVQDRFDVQHSDPDGTDFGDDGDGKDGLNHPEEGPIPA